MAVQFFFTESKSGLKNRRKLKAFIELLFTAEKVNLHSVNYIFCSDEYLLAINKQYLQHDYYTDIITFDISADSSAVVGEIYISLDRVKENAIVFGQQYNNELHRVIFHGALHLCGFKDKRQKDIVRMRNAESKYLSLYFN